jgi:hypothetical protein
LREATIEELLEAVFSVQYLTEYYVYEQERSIISLDGRESTGSKVLNTETEEATAVEAVTRQRPVKRQIEKN